jgi:NitT/TauT family transport system ATP-binding protein
VISLRGVTKRYGSQVVLDRLDLDLPTGVTAVMGPNGSGKTTLGRLLLGLEAPDGGEVRGLEGCRRAAVFQENRLCEQLDAVANVRLVRGAPSPAHAEMELRALGLDEASVRKPVRELSGGQRRRVAIARAFAADAELLVLDEPFTGLDASARSVVIPDVARRCGDRTVLLVTHDPAEAAEFGARVVTLPACPAARWSADL